MITGNRKQRTESEGLLLPYVAVDASRVLEDFQEERLLALTPRIMKWDDELWLLDLSPCTSYWWTRARSHFGATTSVSQVTTLLNQLLQSMCDGPLAVAFAAHPWQAVLLAQHLRERSLEGLVIAEGGFGEGLFRDVSWDNWWQSAEVLAEHWETQKSKGLNGRFNGAQFSKQCGQMRRAAERLGLASPVQLKKFPAAAVQRRFGVLIRDMVQWAYGPAPTREAGELFPLQASEVLFDSGFPWQSLVFASLPSVTRCLETPLCEWSHMESLLREDFDRLLELSSWLSGEKVVCLEWQLVLADLASLVIPIRFRHPHSLHSEKGCQPTALLQALYAFESSPLRSRQAQQSGDFCAAIVGWTLVITERMTLTPQSEGLCGEMKSGVHGSDEWALLQLENKLKLPLEAYRLRPDWTAQDSYASVADRDPQDDLAAVSPVSWIALGHMRPLYLYRSPIRFDPSGRSCVWRFMERTMDKWWSHSEPLLQRDYYRVTDSKMQDQWIFKDGKGRAFVHGLYA